MTPKVKSGRAGQTRRARAPADACAQPRGGAWRARGGAWARARFEAGGGAAPGRAAAGSGRRKAVPGFASGRVRERPPGAGSLGGTGGPETRAARPEVQRRQSLPAQAPGVRSSEQSSRALTPGRLSGARCAWGDEAIPSSQGLRSPGPAPR